jgi:hypothetical protein
MLFDGDLQSLNEKDLSEIRWNEAKVNVVIFRAVNAV